METQSRSDRLVSVFAACLLGVAAFTGSALAQPSVADLVPLRGKLVLDSGELHVARQGVGSEQIEWMEFKGIGHYCMPKLHVDKPDTPAAALLLMDIDRNAFIAVLEVAGGSVEVTLHDAKLMQCPSKL